MAARPFSDPRANELEALAVATESVVAEAVTEAAASGSPAAVLIADVDGRVEARLSSDTAQARLVDAQAERFAEAIAPFPVYRLGGRLVTVLASASRTMTELLAALDEIAGRVEAALSIPVPSPQGDLFAGVRVWREVIESTADVPGAIRRVNDRLGFNRSMQNRYLGRCLARTETVEAFADELTRACVDDFGLLAMTVEHADGTLLSTRGTTDRSADFVYRGEEARPIVIRTWLPSDVWSRAEVEHLIGESASVIGAAFDRVIASEAARDAAERDAMTGLLNRAGLRRRVTSLSSPFTVVIADLDHLKVINDTYGHAAGDRAIKGAADVLARGRVTDLTARWGGEEFVVVLPGAEGAEVTGWLRRMLRTARAADVWPGVTLSFSAGVAECESAAAFEEALERADKALYQAKADGRGLIRTAEREAC